MGCYVRLILRVENSGFDKNVNSYPLYCTTCTAIKCYNSVLYTFPPGWSIVVFGSYSLFSRLCSDDRLEVVATEDSSEKIFSSIFHNLWSGGNLSGECYTKNTIWKIHLNGDMKSTRNKNLSLLIRPKISDR